jgi:ketosteroid isomerase-like protein
VTESNADLVRDAFARWNTGDRESLLEQIDPDVEIQVVSSQVSGRAPFRGHDGYREWLVTMEEAFDIWEIHPAVFREEGDAVLILGHMHLRGRGSGVEFDQETGWIVNARDGIMWRLQTFLSHAEAVAAFSEDPVE